MIRNEQEQAVILINIINFNLLNNFSIKNSLTIN